MAKQAFANAFLNSMCIHGTQQFNNLLGSKLNKAGIIPKAGRTWEGPDGVLETCARNLRQKINANQREVCRVAVLHSELLSPMKKQNRSTLERVVRIVNESDVADYFTISIDEVDGNDLNQVRG